MEQIFKDQDSFITQFKNTPGAISIVEGLAIYVVIMRNLATHGTALDLGAHAGKSSMFASLAFSHLNKKDVFCMVDLLYNPKHPEWKNTSQGSYDNIAWIHAKEPDWMDNVLSVMQTIYPNVVMIGDSSLNVLNKFIQMENMLSYVFLDTGDHVKGLILQEIHLINKLLMIGGLLLFHDCGAQYIDVTEAKQMLVDTGDYEEIGIDWELIKQFVTLEDEMENNSWHFHNEPKPIHPTFIGAIRRVR